MNDTQDQPGWIQLAGGARFPESAMRFQFSRSSGPGGQNVNKVNTRVQFWLPIAAIAGLSESAVARLRRVVPSRITAADEIYIDADTERTQEGNRGAVLERLAEMVGIAIKEPKRRRKTKPSRGSKERRLQGKKRRGEIKQGRRGVDD